MANIVYTRLENGVVVDIIVADDESIELGDKSKALAKLAFLHKDAAVRGRVRSVLNSGNFRLTGKNLSETDDAYKGLWLVLLNGTHKFVPRRISSYKGDTKRVQFIGENRGGAFPNTVEVGDKWMIIGRDPRDEI